MKRRHAYQTNTVGRDWEWVLKMLTKENQISFLSQKNMKRTMQLFKQHLHKEEKKKEEEEINKEKEGSKKRTRQGEKKNKNKPDDNSGGKVTFEGRKVQIGSRCA